MSDQKQPGDAPADQKNRILAARTLHARMLQPKGTCWYCEKAVDNVRRFCSVACREDYFEEESDVLTDSHDTLR